MRPIDVIEGKVSVLDRADVDTDQIIPKQFLKRVERTGYGEFLFYDWIRDGEIELEPNPILVAGRNFGSGSSREHAVWALEDFGFEAIIAPSFADIFYVNCTKIGLLPAILDEEHCRAVAEAGEARIDVDDETVTCAAGVFEFEVEPDVKHRLLKGLDDIGLTLENAGAIDSFEESGGSRPRPGDDGAAVSGGSRTRDWDAASYQRVSVPHEEWAASILDRLDLRGDETVLDAGCGSGRVTSMLIERLPEGRVIAVDGSASMVEQVRAVLRARGRGDRRRPGRLELEEPVDVVFSSAVFHWVLDHDALFASLRRALRPGGRLAAQNGGAGNIARLKASSAEVAAREPYAPHFEGFGEPWNYAAPGGDRRAPRPGRLRRGALLVAALGHRPARAGRVPAHRLPRPLCRPPARGAARPLHRRRPRARRRPARARLRSAEYRGARR